MSREYENMFIDRYVLASQRNRDMAALEQIERTNAHVRTNRQKSDPDA